MSHSVLVLSTTQLSNAASDAPGYFVGQGFLLVEIQEQHSIAEARLVQLLTGFLA